MRWGGSVCFCLLHNLSLRANVKELLKSDHIWQSCRKNRSGLVLSEIRCSNILYTSVWTQADPSLYRQSARTEAAIIFSQARRYLLNRGASSSLGSYQIVLLGDTDQWRRDREGTAPLNFSLSENFLSVGMWYLLSKIQNLGQKIPILGNLGATLNFWKPIIFSVRNLQ